MAFFRLCPDDDLINTLHAVFKTNIVRIPETRIRPLSVIAVTSEKPHFWGDINELIESNITDVQSLIQESRMADISGKRSRSVNLDLGLQILQGFLSGFGLPTAAIAAKFTGAKTVSFSFQGIMRYYISPSQLGRLLLVHALDADHASNNIFFRKEAQLFIIDSIITSKDFSIEEMIGQTNVGVQVVSNNGLDLTFQGNSPLTFAFTCLSCELDEAGRISLKPSSTTTHLNHNQPNDHHLLFNELGMMDWD